MNCGSCASMGERKFRGVRRRKWGKWVSEIRVPGSKERLWLGTYSSPEAAAVAHDVAFYCLKRPSSMEMLNFPAILPSYCIQQHDDMSPRSVQKAASDAGMAVDAQKIIAGKPLTTVTAEEAYEEEDVLMNVNFDESLSPELKNSNMNFNSKQNYLNNDWFLWEGEGMSISVEDYTY